MKRSREWQTQDPIDDEPWTEPPYRTADLERAADAGTLLMPYSARVVHAVGRWPTGADISADVLLLGEYHTAGGVGGGMSVQQMLTLAAERAAAINDCVDVYVEDAIVGVVVPAPQLQQRQFQAVSIDRMRNWLRTAPRDHMRVHLVDSRADLAVEATGEMLDRSLPLRGQPTPWERRNARRCFAWLAGFAPPPKGVEADARSVLFGNDAEETRTWLDLHAAHALKVRKRARGMQRWDVGHLVSVAFEETEWSGDQWWSDIMSSAMDVYAVLRMLAPYRDRPERATNACGQPRHCLLYAGGYHADHVYRVLCRLCRIRPAPAAPERFEQAVMVPASDTTEVGPAGTYPPIETVGQMLEAIGLPRLARHARHTRARRAPMVMQLMQFPGDDPVQTAARLEQRLPAYAMQSAMYQEAWRSVAEVLGTGMYHGAYSGRDLRAGLVRLVGDWETDTAAGLLYAAVRYGGLVPTGEFLSELGRLNAGRGADDWLPRLAVCPDWPAFVRATLASGPELAHRWTDLPLPGRLAREVDQVVVDLTRWLSRDPEWARRSRARRPMQQRYYSQPTGDDF